MLIFPKGVKKDVPRSRLYDSWHSAEHIATPTRFSPHLPSPPQQKWQPADYPVTVDVAYLMLLPVQKIDRGVHHSKEDFEADLPLPVPLRATGVKSERHR
ncbi:MAG: hypothetical protein ACOCXU_01960 [Coleofasciculus sp.]